MNSRFHRHPNWDIALRRLQAVLPAGDDFLPDTIHRAHPVDGHRIDLEGRTDAAIARDLWRLVPKPSGGELIVVTDASWGPDGCGPFFIDAAFLDGLISEHPERVGHVFFDGDVIILELDSNRLTVVHHEGVAWSFTIDR